VQYVAPLEAPQEEISVSGIVWLFRKYREWRGVM